MYSITVSNILVIEIIGCPGDSMLRRSVTLICPLSLYAVGATRVSWSFSSIANSGLLNISSDPRLAIEQNGFHLVLTNVNGDYEGSYSCQAHYSNGRATAQLNAGCVFVAGEKKISVLLPFSKVLNSTFEWSMDHKIKQAQLTLHLLTSCDLGGL